ncbi:hypothetical protein [Bradyrhizobium sp. STM 3562]|uniref:hypothetical protein n=1 Tax=Bradyrhizobium sp. STM 3562 TaxID=578924 RepID=UPI00388D0F49
MIATVVRAMRKAHRRELGACMGAPGPHDFAVRDWGRSSVSTMAATAFRSTFVTTRTSLCKEAERGDDTIDSTFGKTEIFLTRGLDRIFRSLPDGQIT